MCCDTDIGHKFMQWRIWVQAILFEVICCEVRRGFKCTLEYQQKLQEINQNLSNTYSSRNHSKDEDEDEEEQQVKDDEKEEVESVPSFQDRDKRKIFKCDRGGKKEDNKCKCNPQDKSKFSRLIGCPFSAHNTCERGGLVWYYKTKYPHYNHPATKDP
ncbi:putative signal peptide protein [Puccinia sorghi]|uniref:Putative signal peptide protein n=1 Tax=Puccinia sorghi TaxID=27349 RepID=A0A0L6UTS4_9BASI|nr:putative signal peptide protein [Puccinia sorghi]